MIVSNPGNLKMPWTIAGSGGRQLSASPVGIAKVMFKSIPELGPLQLVG